MMTLKRISIAFILAFSFGYSCLSQLDNAKKFDSFKPIDIVQKDTSLDGLYAGLEEMCWTDSTGKKDCYIDLQSRKENGII